MSNAKYCKKTFIGTTQTSSTANICCFDGTETHYNKPYELIHVSISDCRNTVKIHFLEDETFDQYYRKVKRMRDELDKFLEHLSETSNK